MSTNEAKTLKDVQLESLGAKLIQYIEKEAGLLNMSEVIGVLEITKQAYIQTMIVPQS